MKERNDLFELYKTRMIISDSEKEQLKQATVCHICEQQFSKKDIKVADHCHYTGMYRGPAHQKCNIELKVNDKLIVAFFNLRGYDGHLLFNALRNYANSNITIIANNMEKYLTFSIDKIQFIDICQFMPGSLETLAKTLTESRLRTNTGRQTQVKELVHQKNFFPYDWLDSLSKFGETSLPPIDAFSSVLYSANGELAHISEDDYDHARKAWNVTSCKNFGDYHDFYLLTDVLITRICLKISKHVLS